MITELAQTGSRNNRASRLPGRQRGVVLVVATIGMFALLLVTGLALDGGHLLLNKTRLQNAIDTAALNGAKVLDDTGDIIAADVAARAMFSTNASGVGNSELNNSYSGGGVALTVEFSRNLVPFVAGTAPPTFIRVSASNFSFDTLLIRIAGFNQGTVGATAIAGPSPTLSANICDFAPLMMCGDADTNPDDGNLFGYPVNEAVVLKHGSNQDSEVGPGNFQLIRMPGGQGGAVIREALAGGWESLSCLDNGDSVETEPGNTVGPVVQGINTRLGIYKGPVSESEYPGDWADSAPSPTLRLDDDGLIEFTDGSPYNDYTDLTYNHTDYVADYATPAHSAWCTTNPAKCDRRLLTVPVGDCTGTTSGQGNVTTHGFACVYLIQPVVQKGNEAHVFGQLVEGCASAGNFGPNPGSGPQPTKIILYKDPDSDHA